MLTIQLLIFIWLLILLLFIIFVDCIPLKSNTKGDFIILQVICIISLTGGKTSSTINFVSGYNKISSSLQILNNVISYPHTSPVKVNIVPVLNWLFFPKKSIVVFGLWEVDVNPQNVFWFPLT